MDKKKSARSSGKSNRRRRRLSPEVRRRQIVEAAVKLFARRGYQRTTTRQIAAEAGIAEGTIYRYFSSKEELLYQFLKSEALGTLDSLMDSLREAGPEEMVRGFFNDRLDLTEKYSDLMKVIVGEAFYNRKLAGTMSKKLIKPAIRSLENRLEDYMEMGLLRRIDPSLAAFSLMAWFFAYRTWNMLFGDQGLMIGRNELVEGLTDIFLDGLGVEVGEVGKNSNEQGEQR